MRRCGKQYASKEAAEQSRKGRSGRYFPVTCWCGKWHLHKSLLRQVPSWSRPAADTGFSPAVKLAIRTRAGSGDPADACCEACGVFLGEKGGQCQHIVARGAGGTSDPVIDSVVNGALLCGTPFTGCHGLCESRDPRMEAEGFWLKRGKDPAAESFLVHAPGDGSGVRMWRTADGGYSVDAPGPVRT